MSGHKKETPANLNHNAPNQREVQQLQGHLTRSPAVMSGHTEKRGSQPGDVEHQLKCVALRTFANMGED